MTTNKNNKILVLGKIIKLHNRYVVLNGRKCNLSICAQSFRYEFEHENDTYTIIQNIDTIDSKCHYTIQYFKNGKRVAHDIRLIKKMYHKEVSAYGA